MIKLDWQKIAKDASFRSDYEMLMFFRRSGVTSMEVAERLKVCSAIVRRRMKQLGIKRLPTGPRKGINLKEKRDFSKWIKRYGKRNEKEFFMYLYWDLKMSAADIGRLLQCPSQTIQARLISLGISRRSRGQPSHSGHRR